MMDLADEIRAFKQKKIEEASSSAQTAAFRLSTGIDLTSAKASSGAERAAMIIRLRRLIERERVKGARRHWSYDLNRHIALKQALDELNGQGRNVHQMKTAPRGRR